MMKVALASFHLEYRLSGEAEGVFNLKRALEDKGVQVSLIGVDEISNSTSKHEKVLDKFNSLRMLPQKLVDKLGDVDIIQLFLPTPAFAPLVDRVLAKTDKPLVVRFDSQLVDEGLTKVGTRIISDPNFYIPRFIFNNSFWAKRTSRKAASYLVSSNFQAQQLYHAGYNNKQVSVIPNFTYLKRTTDSKIARDKLNLPTSPLITYIGHLFPVKGVNTLLRAFAKVKDSAHLVIAFSGLGDKDALVQELRSLNIEDKTILLGKTDVSQLLAASDVIALPYECAFGTALFPSVILEAIAVGLPIITSDLPPLRELLSSRPCASFITPGNSDKLAEAIKDILSNKTLSERFVDAQSQLHQEQLCPSKIADQYIKHYQAVLNG